MRVIHKIVYRIVKSHLNVRSVCLSACVCAHGSGSESESESESGYLRVIDCKIRRWMNETMYTMKNKRQ